MKKVMLIGFGAMAQAVIERLPAGVAMGWRRRKRAGLSASPISRAKARPAGAAAMPSSLSI